jgi:hypothetical protein
MKLIASGYPAGNRPQNAAPVQVQERLQKITKKLPTLPHEPKRKIARHLDGSRHRAIKPDASAAADDLRLRAN